MHQVLTRRARLALVGLAALIASDAAAQARGTKIAAANEVIAFRVNWMGDSTPFNACSVYRAAERPVNFPEGISLPLRSALDQTATPCEGRRSSGVPGAWTPEVTVDSVTLAGDTAAVVFVTVRKGEISYFEEYSLRSARPGHWSVPEVRIWGALREYPIRPSGNRR